ncbi:VOC family protein [Nevskia sp.]|uniref:VOC family protein n=1 Tax=Nevskia sp. TaxID=1929292 RepID=UPI0025D57E6A|nr:VOC family protein [Nevskia sp.]
MAARPYPTLTPSLLYHDAPAAIAWLERAFGFAPHLVVPGDAPNTIAHAQLTFGNGMVMLGSAEILNHPGMMQSVRAAGGIGTQAVCVYVENVDAAHDRAVAAGAVITLALQDVHYGGRAFSCRDPEGHVWHFGSYDPWT